jgi:hypothetical protein
MAQQSFVLKYTWLFLTAMCIVFFAVDYLLYGPAVAGDTVQYLKMAGRWNNGVVPQSTSYLPGYPLLVSLVADVLQTPLYKAIGYLQGALYVLNCFVLFCLVKKITASHNNPSSFLFPLLLLMCCWWSFRIQKVAHADAFYFSLFLIYLLLLVTILQQGRWVNYLLLSLVLSCMVYIKYNSYILLPFTFVFLLLNGYSNFKQLLLRMSLLIPPVLLILSWKFFNGNFIRQLNTESYQKQAVNWMLVQKAALTNLSYFGKTLTELFISPVAGRWLSFAAGIAVALCVLGLLGWLFFSSSNKIIKLLSAYVLVYVLSFFVLSSLNYFTETNQRTMITATAALVLLFGYCWQVYPGWARFMPVLLAVFFINTAFQFYKWVTHTSLTNNFTELKKNTGAYPVDYSIPDSLAQKNILATNSDELQFRTNYQLSTQEIFVNRQWKFGAFVTMNKADVDSLASAISTEIKKGSIFYFNFPQTENDQYLLSVLQTKNHRYAKRGVNSHLFY